MRSVCGRALGHQRHVIAAQFLVEGAIIGVVGAVAGAAAAVGVVWVVAQARGWVFIANPPLMAAAIGAGVVVTLLAALYPAIRAARLEPLAALRSE